jgi:hypothetical protein
MSGPHVDDASIKAMLVFEPGIDGALRRTQQLQQ